MSAYEQPCTTPPAYNPNDVELGLRETALPERHAIDHVPGKEPPVTPYSDINAEDDLSNCTKSLLIMLIIAYPLVIYSLISVSKFTLIALSMFVGSWFYSTLLFFSIQLDRKSPVWVVFIALLFQCLCGAGLAVFGAWFQRERNIL